MYNHRNSVAMVASVLGLLGVVSISNAEQRDPAAGVRSVTFPNAANCATPNGNVVGTAAITGTNSPPGTCSGSCTLRTNMTKGVDTGVAATRDVVNASGDNNNHLIVCAANDFNPSPNVVRTATNCAGSTLVSISCRDRP